MGQYTDAKLEAFAQATGVKPAEGARLHKLEEVQRLAFLLIQRVEREKAGIRDGDGCWHGSDVLGGTIHTLVKEWESDETPDDNLPF